MAITSLAAARARLHTLITTGSLPSGVTVAYAHEPAPGHLLKPAAITIYTAGMTPTDYLTVIRIYVTTDVDVATAQDTLDTLIMTVDARMTSEFGPSNWEVDWNQELGALVASCVFQVGREDAAAFR